MTLNEHVDRIFLINLERRPDRLGESLTELVANGLDPEKIEVVKAFDCPEDGHRGCSRSHRELLRRVAVGPWDRVLVAEDDIKAITLPILRDAGFTPQSVVWRTFCQVLGGGGTINERFAAMSPFLPDAFDVLYLSCGYGEPPISRLNRHVLRCGFMQGTSLFCITRDFARIWTEKVDAAAGGLENHPGPIDNVFGAMSRNHLYYVLQPRMAFQRASLSDITGVANSYLFSHSDPAHENLIPQ